MLFDVIIILLSCITNPVFYEQCYANFSNHQVFCIIYTRLNLDGRDSGGSDCSSTWVCDDGDFLVESFKGLKATKEWQDDGAGILHQVAQFLIDQVYFLHIQGAMPLSTHTIPRETRYWLQSR